MASKDSQGMFAPGSYEFKKVLLRDHDIDVRFKVLEINIFESIFQPCMTADVLLLDAENMVANLPIAEGDVMEIHLACNPEDKIQQNVDGEDIKCTMEIIKITTRVKTTSQDVQTYNIRLASPGWSDNVRTRISRGYKSKKYSDVVQELFGEKFNHPLINGLKGRLQPNDKKQIVCEPTNGQFSFVIPRWKPIQTFNWLAGRSQSKSNPSAVNYVFYEDKEQFNYCSIESLLAKGASEKYYVKLQNVDKYDSKNYQNVFSYEYHDTGDVLLYAMNGTLGSRMISHNIVSKQVNDHATQGFYSLDYNVTDERFDYVDEFYGLSHCDKRAMPLIDEMVSETLSSVPGNTRLFVQPKHFQGFGDMDDDKSEEWLRQRTMQKPLLKFLRLTLHTIGNFRRKAGEVITLELPSPEESKGDKDARLNGNYLVTSVRRMFKPSKHEIVLEVMKDNLSG